MTFVIGILLLLFFIDKLEMPIMKMLRGKNNIADYGICKIKIDDTGIEIVGRERIQWDDVRAVREGKYENLQIMTITYKIRRDARNIYIQNTTEPSQVALNLNRAFRKTKKWHKNEAPKEIDEETYEKVKDYLNRRYDFAKS